MGNQDLIERTNMGENSGTGFVAGLEDVVAAETRLSGVDGEAGELTRRSCTCFGTMSCLGPGS
jgi:citrate synthase